MIDQKQLNPASKAREVALQFLFEVEFRLGSELPMDVVSDLRKHFSHFAVEGPSANYAELLVSGSLKSLSEVDELIQSVSPHWKIPRMASVDRLILRLASYEMVFLADGPNPKIVINEAVNLAKKFGSESSPKFVNGLLDEIRKKRGL